MILFPCIDNRVDAPLRSRLSIRRNAPWPNGAWAEWSLPEHVHHTDPTDAPRPNGAWAEWSLPEHVHHNDPTDAPRPNGAWAKWSLGRMEPHGQMEPGPNGGSIWPNPNPENLLQKNSAGKH